MTEAEAGASSETETEEGNLNSPYISPYLGFRARTEAGKGEWRLGRDREGRAYDLYRGTLAE